MKTFEQFLTESRDGNDSRSDKYSPGMGISMNKLNARQHEDCALYHKNMINHIELRNPSMSDDKKKDRTAYHLKMVQRHEAAAK